MPLELQYARKGNCQLNTTEEKWNNSYVIMYYEYFHSFSYLSNERGTGDVWQTERVYRTPGFVEVKLLF
jgi:hypothetical protein